MHVSPETTAADIEDGVAKFGYVGLKCYHFFAKGRAQAEDANILEYLTEEQCAAADKLELAVSLQVSQSW